jgi:hypothetical protein
LILDAGVLISIDRAERSARRVLEVLSDRAVVRTTEPVVAQVWRDGARQALLADVLGGTVIHPFVDGRSIGRLLRASGTSDVVDAHLVHLAALLGEPVLTGDPDDLRSIAATFGAHAPVIHAWP